MEFTPINTQEEFDTRVAELYGDVNDLQGKITAHTQTIEQLQGQIKGYDLKIQLYTVPGQVKYNATRKLVLKGVDGIVFVADAQEQMREKNIRSLNQLHENLQDYKESIFRLPLVLQYNKVDLRNQGIPVLPTSVLDKDLNSKLKVPTFEASALTGYNVPETLKKIISSTVISIQKKLM